MLCPFIRCHSRWGHLARLLAGLVLSLAATWPGHAQTRAMADPPTAPSAAAGNGQQALYEAAGQWAAQFQPGGAPVRFAPLDSRVRVQPCAQPLQFDYPFSASRETVRVRCQAPTAWQLFLRVLPQTADVAPPVASVASGLQTTAAPAARPATRPVVVTRRLVQRGTAFDAQMLEVVERPVQGLDPLVIGSMEDVLRAEATRDLPPGTALRSYDIKRALLVRKGQNAMLTVGQNTGFVVSVKVEAMQDGHLGEQIRLKNTESGRLLSGVVTGPNAVRGLVN